MKRFSLRVSNKSEKQYLHDEKREAHSKKENNMKEKKAKQFEELWTQTRYHYIEDIVNNLSSLLSQRIVFLISYYE